jgi:DNA-directed RNA polymerase specialized sigma24 family protein
VLRKVYGYSQHEIAVELDLTESTVEKHIALGIKRCTHFIRDEQHRDAKTCERGDARSGMKVPQREGK